MRFHQSILIFVQEHTGLKTICPSFSYLVGNGGHVFAGVGLPGGVEIVLLQLREEEEELLQRIVEVVGHLHGVRFVLELCRIVMIIFALTIF